MQRHPRWRDALGVLTLMGALLLASPGVGVARADSALERSGPICSSAKLRQPQDPSLELFLAQVRQKAVAQRTRSERADREGGVELNNRGYNYTATFEPPPERSRPPTSTAPNR